MTFAPNFGRVVFRVSVKGSEVYVLLTWIIFLFVGVISGVIIAWSLDMKTPKELIQGAVGGLISGFLMSAMLPH